MINPIGSRFNTVPVTYFKLLAYMPDTGAEFQGAGTYTQDGTLILLDNENSPFTIHGDLGLDIPDVGCTFWLSSGTFFGDELTINTNTRESEYGRMWDGVVGCGSFYAGMDDLVIYKPTDLFQRIEEIDAQTGETHVDGAWVRIEDSYLLSYDSGFMDQEASVSQVWIHRLQVYPDYAFYVSGGATSANYIPPLLISE